jgi:hypothetical protein
MPAPPPETDRPSEDVPALPEGSLLLHIGPPKTGSTAIQRAMHESRADLAAHGVLYPGTTMRARGASWAVMGTKPAVGRPAPRIESWRALVDEINGSALPRVCLSHENFSRADDDAAARIVDDLGRDRTHVVYVARRLDRVLPSHWQERVKAWHTETYDAFLRRYLAAPTKHGTTWAPHDVAAVLGRWSALVGPDRVTVVVSDEQDHALIPRTFEALLALPAGTLSPPTSRSNMSLSYTEAEALRAVNAMAREAGWSQREYWQVVQNGIVGALGERSRSGDTRIEGLPDWAFAGVAERSDAQIATLRESGVRVLGDPERLRISEHGRPAPLPETVESVPLDLVAALVRGAVDGTRTMKDRDATRAVRKARRGARRTATDQLDGRRLARLLAGRIARRLGLRRG